MVVLNISRQEGRYEVILRHTEKTLKCATTTLVETRSGDEWGVDILLSVPSCYFVSFLLCAFIFEHLLSACYLHLPLSHCINKSVKSSCRLPLSAFRSDFVFPELMTEIKIMLKINFCPKITAKCSCTEVQICHLCTLYFML